MKKINSSVSRNTKTVSSLQLITNYLNASFGISQGNFIWVAGKLESQDKGRRMEKD